MRPPWSRKGRVTRAGGEVGGEQLLEQEGRRGERRDLGLRQERGELVAEGEEAGGLEPDDAAPRATNGDRASSVRRASCARLVDQAGREEGAAAAERAAAVGRLDAVQAVAGGGEHPLGGVKVLAARSSG